MKKFLDKLALISGGSSGIGLALAKQLSQKGCNVWILARNRDNLIKANKLIEANKCSINQRFGYICADVSSNEVISVKLKRFIGSVGIPDFLINSAGISHPGEFVDQSISVFQEMMNTNYFGTVYPTKIILRGMVSRGSGHIINISSLAGYLGAYGYSAYGASKFAVRGFSDVIRAELKPHKIRVSVVFPPDTDTPQFAYENKFKPEITRIIDGNVGLLSAEEVAKEIIKGIEKNKYLIIPGVKSKIIFTLSNVLGGFTYPILDILVSQAQKKINNK